MKIQNKKRNKKVLTIVIISILVVVFAAGIAFWLVRSQPTPSSSNSTTTNSSDTQTNNNTTKGDGNGNDKTTDEIPVDTVASASITQLVQQNRNIVASASVNNVDASGSCSFTFTSEFDDPVSRTSTPADEGETITCGPIEVSDNEFSYLGEWLLTFRYYIDGKQIVAEEKITVQ